jgi:hypothetical protein
MRRTGEPEESGESGENDLLSFKAARLVQIQVLVVLRRRSKHGVEVINPSLVEASRCRAVIHTVQYSTVPGIYYRTDYELSCSSRATWRQVQRQD